MPQDLTDDKSTLVQVMAWCCQATSHYLNQCWPRSPTPYGVTIGQNELRWCLYNETTYWPFKHCVLSFLFTFTNFPYSAVQLDVLLVSAMKIHLSPEIYRMIQTFGTFQTEPRGEIEIKVIRTIVNDICCKLWLWKNCSTLKWYNIRNPIYWLTYWDRNPLRAWAPFLAWVYSNPSMDKWLHPLLSMGWNYISISKRQQRIRWSLGTDK